MTRERGTLLNLLTLDDLQDEVDAFAREQEGEWTGGSIADTPWAVAVRGDKVYAVCEEGVGVEVTDDEPLELLIYGERKDESGSLQSFGIMPIGALRLPKSEVLERVGDEIDLADLVRVFGGRLEANFLTWRRTLGSEA